MRTAIILLLLGMWDGCGTSRAPVSEQSVTPTQPPPLAVFSIDANTATMRVMRTAHGELEVFEERAGQHRAWTFARHPPLEADRQHDYAVQAIDVDRDGRTDLVVSTTVRGEQNPSSVVAYLRTERALANAELEIDYGSALALMGARRLNDLATLFEQVQRQSITREEACEVLRQASTESGWEQMVLPDAVLVEFVEPQFPMYRPRVSVLRSHPEARAQIGNQCEHLQCFPNRGSCLRPTLDGPTSEVYWFRWVGGSPRLRGFARYEGS